MRSTIVHPDHACLRLVGILRVLVVCLLAAAPAGAVQAQQTPLKGIVWNVPDGLARAKQDLQAISEAGIEAVRTELIREEELLDLADTLGLQLYMDLPVSRLPAPRLRDTLAYASSLVDTLAAIAVAHPSVRAVGLTRYSDTSDTSACEYLRTLADRVRQSAPEIRTYYVTRFIQSDACASTVDFVLAGVRGRAEPAAALRKWAAQEGRPPLGIAALGTSVRDDSLRGLRVQRSPEQQARYLERQLSILLSDTLSVDVPAVFVYRWRDVRRAFVDDAGDFDRPAVQRYGLHGVDGRPRPAFRVVSGLYTGSQDVFAFDRGTAPPSQTPWTTLLGWLVIAGVGTFYALSPRFRHMVPRYFQAHFFFREAVREGRDVLFGASVVLLAALGAAGGLVWHVVVDAAQTADAFALVLQWLSPATRGALAAILARPLAFLVLVGCLYVIGLLVWTVILSLLSHRKYQVSPTQVLMLVLWPRWPQLVVMVGAMVVVNLAEPSTYLIAALAAGWVLFAVTAVARSLADLYAVTRIAAWLLVPAVILNPGVLLTAVLAVVALSHRPEVEFVLHAALRS